MGLISTLTACGAMGACYLGYRKNMHQWIFQDVFRYLQMKTMFQ